MNLQFDKLDGIYKAKDEYQKARDEDIITEEELDAKLVELQNEIRIELGFEPAEA